MSMNNGLSILKVVNGLSKTLNIANQMIPLYKQVKPMIANSKKIVNGIKNLNQNKLPNTNNNNNTNTYNNNNRYNNSSFTSNPENNSNYIPNAPTFFQ